MTGFPHVDSVEHRFVEAAGLRMHVAEAGDGPPLLLLHGWPQHWYQWRGVITALAGSRRLIAPDLRGFGWTDVPEGPINPDVFVADVVALLDALGLDQVDVAGHDWGGITSFLLSARHPGRVRKVLALSAPHPWVTVTPRLALEAWRGWYAIPLSAGVIRRDPSLAGRPIRGEGVPPEEVEPYVDRLRDPDRAGATSRLYRSYLTTLATTVRGGRPVPRSSSPTLLMIGENDPAVTPRLGAGLERGGDDMRFEVIAGAGHFVCDTHAPLIADRARTHLA
jgi:pimeloyl-ACP methyl ester carboxylesterase